MPSFGDLVRDWQRGAQAVERGDWGCALQLFSSVPDPPARICFNVGCVHLLAGDPEAALQVSQVAPGLASGTLPVRKLSSDPGVHYLLCAGSVRAVIKPRAHALPPDGHLEKSLRCSASMNTYCTWDQCGSKIPP